MERQSIRVVVVLGIAVLLALSGWLLLAGDEPAPSSGAAMEDAEDEAWADWDLEAAGDRGAEPELDRGPRPPAEPPPATSGDTPSDERSDWRARRERWWSQLSEEERAQARARRRGRVEIVPLGPTPANLDEDGVRDALREQFPAMRECFREAGGFRAMREAMQARGATGRPTVRFDVGPDGAIAEGTLSIDPPMPDAFDACVRSAFTAARFGDVGGEGAGVEMQMGRGRRRGGSDSLDGGTPRGGRRGRER